jgi:hypothetical protein
MFMLWDSLTSAFCLLSNGIFQLKNYVTGEGDEVHMAYGNVSFPRRLPSLRLIPNCHVELEGTFGADII